MKNSKVYISGMVILMAFFVAVRGSAQDWKWAVNGTGTNHTTEFLATDSYNNSYFAVYYNDSLSIGGQSYFHHQWQGDYNCLVIKLDRQGNLLNQIDLYSLPGLMSSMRPLTMASDSMGNVYLAGSFAVRLFIGDTIINHLALPYYEGPEAFLVKFNPDFDIAWAKVIGCEHYMYFQNMLIRNNQICYSVNPHSWASADPIALYCFGQDTIYFSNDQEYFFYFQLNLEGQIVSHSVLHGTSFGIVKEVIAGNNDKYLIGVTTDTIFEQEKPVYVPDTVYQWDQFILHYDGNDSLIGTSTVKTSDHSYVNIVAANSKNELYFYTTFVNGLTIGDTVISSIYGYATILGKLDARQNPVWYDNLVGLDTPSDIFMTLLHDTLYTAFDFYYYLIFPDTTLLNLSLIYENNIIKYTPDGKRISYLQTNTTGNSHTGSIAFDKCENLLLSGTFQGEAYYGSDTIVSYYPSGSVADFFVAYLSNAKKDIDLGKDTTVCGHYFITGPGGFDHYSWNNGTVTQKDLLITETGQYKLKAWTDKCCFMEDSVYINILPMPAIDLGNDTLLKKSLTLQLSVPAGYEKYTWSTGAATNFIVLDGSKLVTGNHIIWCEVTNNNCTSSDSLKIEVVDDYGISEQHEIEIQIKPNPFADKFSVLCEKPISEMEVYDYSGKRIATFHPSQEMAQSIPFALPVAENRFLILKFSTPEGIYYRKVVQIQSGK